LRGIIDDDDNRIGDIELELQMVKDFYGKLYNDPNIRNWFNFIYRLMREDRKTNWVSFDEIIEAIELVNTTKACGTDLTFPEILKLTDVKVHLARYIEDILNQQEIKIPDYMRESRLVLLSKGNSCFAQI
jgi:hypothetical protein